MIIPKPETFDALLPATSVTQQMRDRVNAIAIEQGISMADVMRYALSLFLDSIDSNSVNESEHISQRKEVIAAQ